MTQQQLEYFMELARTLNFTKVSKRFLISQTAVSKQIQSLEDEVGVKLFNRTSRQVELTSAGRALAQDAAQILSGMYDAVDRLQKAATGFTGNLRIGYAKGLEKTNFHQPIARFCRHYPYVSVSFVRQNDFNLYMSLDSFEIDVAFGQQYQSQNPAYARIPLFSAGIYCGVHKDDPLATKNSITLDELKDAPLLLMSSAHDLPKASGLRLGRLPYFPFDFDPKRVTWTKDMESALLMAAMHMGIAPVPSYMTAFSVPQSLRFVPLENSSGMVRVQAIRRSDNTNPTLRELLPYLEEPPRKV